MARLEQRAREAETRTARHKFAATAIAVGCLFLVSLHVMAQPRKVLFDTDSAFFLDDGAALVMLLQRPDLVEVVGVTVVSGNLWARKVPSTCSTSSS